MSKWFGRVADIMRKSLEGMGHLVEMYYINAVQDFFLRKLEGRGRIGGPNEITGRHLE
jgi:hypothetical protein